MGVGDRVVAVSEAVRRDMIGRGISARRLVTIPNATLGSARSERSTTEVPVALAHPNVLTVAGMYARKGISDLLQAFRLLSASAPEVTLYLVGDGPDRERFMEEARRLGLADRAVFLRFRRDIQALMRQADVFVLASHAEPNGLVIAEAREAGCAIVATAVGGIPEVLDGGRAGLLVPARDPQALGRALTRVSLDAGLRVNLRTAAREGIERFCVRHMCDDVLAVYRGLLPGRG